MSKRVKREVTVYLSKDVVEKIDEMVRSDDGRHRWTRSWLMDNILGDRLGLWPWTDDNIESDEQ